MTVTPEAYSSAQGMSGGNPTGNVTWMHPGVSPDGVVVEVICYCGEFGGYITSATYGGRALVLNCTIQGPYGSHLDHGAPPVGVFDDGNFWFVSLYGLADPDTPLPTGSQQVVIQFNGLDVFPVAGCITVTGNDRSSVFRATGVTATGTSTTPSIVIPSAVGDLVVDELSAGPSMPILNGSMDGLNVTDLTTSGSPNTRHWKETIDGYGNMFTGAGSTALGAASVTMNWAKVGSAGAHWYAVGASIKSAATPGWEPVKVGPGGFITGLNFSADGLTKMCRTDTYGAFILENGVWQNMEVADRMPDESPGGGSLVYEIVHAPTDPRIIYMWFNGGVYKSTDRGKTFTKTAYTFTNEHAGGWWFGTRTHGPYIAVDPHNANVVYVGAYNNRVQLTTDGGTTWSNITAIPTPSSGMIVNGAHGVGATSIAVHGGDGGVAFGAWASGYVFESDKFPGTIPLCDPGQSVVAGSGTLQMYTAWNYAAAPAIPDGTRVLVGGGSRIVFDRNSAVTGTGNSTRTQGIYIFVYGEGAYKSTDGGANWTKMTGGPQTSRWVSIASTGRLYVCDEGSQDSNIWTCGTVGTVLTKMANLSVGNSYGWNNIQCVAISPIDENHIVAIDAGGAISQSFNAGTTWTGVYNQPRVRSAPEIPWMEKTMENWFSTSSIAFDPLVDRKLYISQGIGVWQTTTPLVTAPFATVVTWVLESSGIEQLVTRRLVKPPGGKLVAFFMDRAVFYINDPAVFPADHGPDYSDSIRHGHGGDWAKNDPTFLVGVFNFSSDHSGYSTNGGLTWTQFPTMPPFGGGSGGSIAASTTQNFVWVPETADGPYYTLDRGQSWISSDPDPGGWGWNTNVVKHCVTADSEVAGKFAIYSASGDATGGFYISTTGGASWTKVGSYILWSAYNVMHKSVPYFGGTNAHTAGHYFFTQGIDDSTALYYTRNSWAARTAIAGVASCVSFGFGRAAPDKNYPTIFMIGVRSGEFGIWKGEGNDSDWAAGGNTGSTVTWTNLGAYPYGHYDIIRAVEGDPDIYGQCYVGFSGSGVVYYNMNAVAEPYEPPPPPDVGWHVRFRLTRN